MCIFENNEDAIKFLRTLDEYKDKSEAVEDDKYLLTVLRYIHQNHLKAGITRDIKEYRWSSYKVFRVF